MSEELRLDEDAVQAAVDLIDATTSNLGYPIGLGVGPTT